MSHAMKKVPPKQVSFVAAVKQWGDRWVMGAVPLACLTDEKTPDWKDACRMERMERGTERRV